MRLLGDGLRSRVYRENGAAHHLTNRPPLTSGQVERMNRTLLRATFKCYPDKSQERFRAVCSSRFIPTTSPAGSIPRGLTTGTSPMCGRRGRTLQTRAPTAPPGPYV
ncbi:MAG: hypothetical protein JWQ36_1691 [Enterovirga sp.]|jgi:hypothetical protein|nr:hypothetical protein [Enterovirga sp.]